MYNRLCLRLLLLILAVAMLVSCTDKTSNLVEAEYTDIIFQAVSNDLMTFAITPDAEVYAVAAGEGLGRYDADGILLDTYPGTEHLGHIYYTNGFLYAYDHESRDILEINVNTKERRAVYEDLDVRDIQSLAVVGGTVYMMIIPWGDFDDTQDHPDGYVNFNEKLIEIDIKSGNMTERPEVVNPIAAYLASDGTLYVYSHPDKDYILSSYDIKSHKLKKITEMNDAGRLFSFAYENGFFLYHCFSDIKAKRMADGFIFTCIDDVHLSPGSGMVYFGGNIIFLKQVLSADPEPVFTGTVFNNMRVGKETVTLLNGSGDITPFGGEVVISVADYSRFLDTDVLRTITGISAMYSSQPTGDSTKYNEFLTSIMAGDPNIDIYILLFNEDITHGLISNGFYVPLNGSAKIQSYLDRCFDWVGETAKAPNGDIWMLPVYHNTPALWYVPENFERFGLVPADVEHYDRYIETLERINLIKDEYTTYARFLSDIIYIWNIQYEMTYCDLQSHSYIYDTPLYRRLFESWWSGWDMTKDYHPVMGYDLASFYEGLTGGFHVYDADFNTEKVIFRLDYINQQFENAKGLNEIGLWRALPMPKVSNDVDRNYFITTYAFVNPHGKNKEQAVKYLEAVAENMLAVNKRPIFTLKEPVDYEGYYDMSIPVYMDLHDIYRNGSTGLYAAHRAGSKYIIDYQAGSITLNEAIQERQRQVEMWLHE